LENESNRIDPIEKMLEERGSPEAAALQARRKWAVVFAAIVFFSIGGFLTTHALRARTEALEHLTTREARLTLDADDGGRLESVDRSRSPEVFYRVVLENAPIGTTLDLSCDWIDPAGSVVHKNRYTTKKIDKSLWPTHCKNQFGPGSPPGAWVVDMSLGGRSVSRTSFEVR